MRKVLLILIILFSTNAYSFEKTTNFTFKKFKEAQMKNRTIVINSWNKNCTTCDAQSIVFAEALHDFKNVDFFFYEQTEHKEIATALNIKFWTTIVVYKGKEVVAKEIGLVNKEEIYKMIKKGI